MSPLVKKILWQSALITVVIFIVTALLIIPNNPAPQNYLLSIIAVLSGARLFSKYRNS
jgi:hypothetical protein